MTDISTICSLLSNDVYRRGQQPNTTSLFTSIDIGTIISGATVLKMSDVNTDGFVAVAYRIDDTIVIAYRGTDDSVDPDTGWPLGTGHVPEQALLAAEFYQDVLANYVSTGDNVVLTGHSLGGGLAGFVAGVYDLEAYIYDPSSFEDAIVQAHTDGIGDEYINHSGTEDPEGLLSENYIEVRDRLYGAGPGAIPALQSDANQELKVHAYALAGEVNTSARLLSGGVGHAVLETLSGPVSFDAPDWVYTGGWEGLPFAPNDENVALHHQTLLVIRQAVDAGDVADWRVGAEFVFEGLFDDSLAKTVGFRAIGAEPASNFLQSAIAYSVAGGTAFGSTATTSLNHDTVVLGEAGAVFTAQPAVAYTAIQYAGLLAQMADTTHASGVISVVHDGDDLQVDLSDAAWTLGSHDIDFSDFAAGWALNFAMATVGFSMSGDNNFWIGNFLGTSINTIQYALTDETHELDGSADVYVDSSESDEVIGTEGSDIIFANVGGSGQEDTIFGGTGDDQIYGSTGSDYLFGGLTDEAEEDAGFDQIYAGDGFDTVVMSGGGVVLGQGDADTITAHDVYWVHVDGGTGDDVITVDLAEGGIARVTGGAGHDFININTDHAIRILVINDPGATEFSFLNMDETSIFDTYFGGNQIAYDVLLLNPDEDDLRINDHWLRDGTYAKVGEYSDETSIFHVDQGWEWFGFRNALDDTTYGVSYVQMGTASLNSLDYYRSEDLNPLPAGGQLHPNNAFVQILNFTSGEFDVDLNGNGPAWKTYYGGDLTTPQNDGPDVLPEGWHGEGNVDLGAHQAGLSLLGGPGDDTLEGSSGADLLYPIAGNDLAYGHDGDDVFEGGSGEGDDLYDGGDGSDWITFPSSFSGLLIDLDLGTASGPEIGVDTLVSIENVEAGSGDDTIVGNSADNRLLGDDGDDSIDGAHGADSLSGGAGTDTLNGGDGDDVIEGGDGVDSLDGGNGFDIVSYAASATGIIFDTDHPENNSGDPVDDTLVSFEGVRGTDLNDEIVLGWSGGAAWGAAGDDLIDASTALSVSIYGGDGADTLLGSNGDDLIDGGEGNNEIYGNDGDDVLIIGTWAETIDGGDGFDVISFAGYYPENGIYVTASGSATSDTFINIEAIAGSAGDDYIVIDVDGFAASGGDGNDELTASSALVAVLQGDAGDDFLFGGEDADTLDGGDGNDILVGGDGADTVVGGDGFDIASYVSADAGVVLDIGTMANSTGDASGDTFSGIEAVRGSLHDDELRLDASTLVAWGDDGDDLIVGVGDAVSLQGGEGADTLYGAEGNDLLDGGDGTDHLFGLDGDDVLFGSSEEDVLDGGDGFDIVSYENAHNGVFLLTGGSPGLDSYVDIEAIRGAHGDDEIFVQTNDLLIWGGEGNDTVIVSAEGVTVYGEVGDDYLEGGDWADQLDGGLGLDTIVGGDGDDSVVGGEGDDDLQGESDSDALQGGTGDDLLDGGDGADTLAGGLGGDTLTGGSGDDTFVFQSTDDSLPELADTIADFTSGDVIDLSGIDADETVSSDQAFVLDLDDSFSAGEIRQTVVGSDLLIELNTDEDEDAEMGIVIAGRSSLLTGADFVL